MIFPNDAKINREFLSLFFMLHSPVYSERIFTRALAFALSGSRGGPMRGRILVILCERPLNPLALAKTLSIDYKTALYHIEKLQKQNLLVKKGEGYGATYTPTFTPEQRVAFCEMAKKWEKPFNEKGEEE